MLELLLYTNKERGIIMTAITSYANTGWRITNAAVGAALIGYYIYKIEEANPVETFLDIVPHLLEAWQPEGILGTLLPLGHIVRTYEIQTSGPTVWTPAEAKVIDSIFHGIGFLRSAIARLA